MGGSIIHRCKGNSPSEGIKIAKQVVSSCVKKHFGANLNCNIKSENGLHCVNDIVFNKLDYKSVSVGLRAILDAKYWNIFREKSFKVVYFLFVSSRKSTLESSPQSDFSIMYDTMSNRDIIFVEFKTGSKIKEKLGSLLKHLNLHNYVKLTNEEISLILERMIVDSYEPKRMISVNNYEISLSIMMDRVNFQLGIPCKDVNISRKMIGTLIEFFDAPRVLISGSVDVKELIILIQSIPFVEFDANVNIRLENNKLDVISDFVNANIPCMITWGVIEWKKIEDRTTEYNMIELDLNNLNDIGVEVKVNHHADYEALIDHVEEVTKKKFEHYGEG